MQSAGDILQKLRTAFGSFPTEYIYYTLTAVLGIIIGVWVNSRRSKTRFDRGENELGRLKRIVADKERVSNSELVYAAQTNQQMAQFSFLTVLAASIGYGAQMDSVLKLNLFGIALGDGLTILAILVGFIGLFFLWNVWAESRVFQDFHRWKAHKVQKINKLQKRNLMTRYSDEIDPTQLAALAEGHPRQVSAEVASVDSGISAPQIEDDIKRFNQNRIDLHFSISKRLGEDASNQPWEVGRITKIGNANFGFVRKIDSRAQTAAEYESNEEFFFQTKNVCNQIVPSVDDVVFFVPIARSGATHRHAFLICVDGEPLSGLVQRQFGERTVFIEIADGADNFASVLGILPPHSKSAPAIGSEVRGRVSHNGRGVCIENVETL